MSLLPAIIKNEGPRVATTSYIDFSDAQGQINSIVSGGISPKFEIIQAFNHVLLTCKNEVAKVATTFLPLKVYGDFSRR